MCKKLGRDTDVIEEKMRVARELMVGEIRRRDVADERVLAAMLAVRRLS